MARYRLTLLGDFRLCTGNGREIRVPARKAQALLAYLALNPDLFHSRERLADFLWGSREDSRARQNLRKCLAVLRKAVGTDGQPFLIVTREGIILNSAHVDIDILALEQCINANRLGDALKDYSGGELLECFHVESDVFERWLVMERARIAELVANAMYSLAEIRYRENNVAESVMLAKRLVEMDPSREDGQRLLMLSFDKSGQKAAAIRQYHECATYLDTELGVSPAYETTRLFDTIRIPETHCRRSSKRPAIVVVPLNDLGHGQTPNLGKNITEELIVELSRCRWFYVIPNDRTVFAQDATLHSRSPSCLPGTHYILDGSTRFVGARVRILVKLIHASSGKIVWANRFDRDINEAAGCAMNLAQSIAAQIIPEVTEFESRNSSQMNSPETDAWTLWQYGLAQLFRYSKESTPVAKRFFKQSMEADSEFAPAYASMSIAEEHDALFNDIERENAALNRSFELAKTAVSLDARDALAHYALGRSFIRRGDIDSAVVEMETAVAFCPSFALAHHGCGSAKYYNGSPQDAVLAHGYATRLSPADPERWAFYHMRARSHFDLYQYEIALDWAGRAIRQPNTKPIAFATYAAVAWRLGEAERSREIIRQLRIREPAFTVDRVLQNFSSENISSHMDRFAETLTLAGLP